MTTYKRTPLHESHIVQRVNLALKDLEQQLTKEEFSFINYGLALACKLNSMVASVHNVSGEEISTSYIHDLINALTGYIKSEDIGMDMSKSNETRH